VGLAANLHWATAARVRVSRLMPREMKAVTLDKNVPEAIRKAAKKYVREPGQGTR